MARRLEAYAEYLWRDGFMPRQVVAEMLAHYATVDGVEVYLPHKDPRCVFPCQGRAVYYSTQS
jgi:hypothetical protein